MVHVCMYSSGWLDVVRAHHGWKLYLVIIFRLQVVAGGSGVGALGLRTCSHRGFVFKLWLVSKHAESSMGTVNCGVGHASPCPVIEMMAADWVLCLL